MNLSATDREWLAQHFPDLLHDPIANNITGKMNFCAAYNKETRRLHIGDNDVLQQMGEFLCDSFLLCIDLSSIGEYGWPKVYEVGGRCEKIAASQNVKFIDLHLFSDGSCCLGLRISPERSLTIELFICELVIPFLYRLAYVERHGLLAARNELWGEYAHGKDGIRQHESEILNIAARDPGRNELCPCGSGRKFKRCHLDEVKALKKWS